MKSIAIDLTSLNDNFSGIERYASYISLSLLENEDYYFYLFFKEKIHPLFFQYKNKKNIKIIVIKPYKKLLFNQIVLPKHMKKCKADYYLFLAFPVPIFMKKKNVLSTIHDIACWDCPDTMKTMSKWYFRISQRRAAKKCKYVITISEFSKQRIVDKLHTDPKKIIIAYCAVDDKFDTNKINKNDIYNVKEKYKLPDNFLLSLSTLEPRKNLPLLLKAFDTLVNKDDISINLVLAGRKGWKVDNLLEGLSDKTKSKLYFTGFVDDKDLPALYAAADIFVFPSLYEGFGIPPLEAISCGTLTISSNSSSLPEVLKDGAIYFENNNLDDLYNTIKNALQNIETKKKDMKNKMDIVSKSYNWNSSNEILKVIK